MLHRGGLGSVSLFLKHEDSVGQRKIIQIKELFETQVVLLNCWTKFLKNEFKSDM